MTFSVTIDRDQDGAWVVECPAIPGCVSQGATKAEAIENIQDAIKLCLETRAARGMPLTGVALDSGEFPREDLVPTLRVGMPSSTLRVVLASGHAAPGAAERPRRHSHAERGNE